MAMFDKHKSSKQPTPEAQQPKVSPQAPSLSAKPPSSAGKVAMIGQGISISGDVKADTSLKVEGQIEGRGIQCTHDVEIAESGQVKASIIAKTVKVSGVVSGDIGGSEKVLIAKTGRVQGNIVAPRVQLEDGALFRGSIDMNPAEPAAAKKPEPVKEQKQTTSAPKESRTASKDPARKEPSLNLKSG